jgi:Uma2 family endonuclease
MSEPAFRHWTVDEFLDWEDGTDTRYELIGGIIVAMAPPAAAHGRLSANLIEAIGPQLRARRPCAAYTEAGIVRPDRNDTCYVADIAVTCEPLRSEDRLIRNPVLIVEILSPSTEHHDRRVKLPVYRQIDTVQEILLIASDGIYAELHRRAGTQWITEILREPDAVLSLISAGMEVRLGELYDGIALAEPKE